MVATTRSRGSGGTTRSRGSGGLTATPTPVSASNDAASEATDPSKKDKVYRKAAPPPKLLQQTFAARMKTVRAAKRTTAAHKRLSLPDPSTSARKERVRTKAHGDEDGGSRQKTLTQMKWVPSTYPSGDEGMDDELEPLRVDLSDMDDVDGDEAEGAASGSKKKKAGSVGKKKVVVKKAVNRGRKRRKTTGDLELELERRDGDEDEEGISSSRYHTQTLTQMPSWRGLAGMVVDSDEDQSLEFLFEDDMPHFGGEEREGNPGETPQRKKRKRQSASPPPAGLGTIDEPARNETSAPDPSISSHAPLAPPESTNPSVVPETPHHPRAKRTEIPSSQPSPFTPNLDLLGRYVSPINHRVGRGSPLGQRSTNLNAPAPTPSAMRKRLRSEIPDSWSTVHGGIPSSGGGSGPMRMPLNEIHFANHSAEFGENCGRPSQRTINDVIMDSEEEFEGFGDDAVEAPGTPTPPTRPTVETTDVDDKEATHTAMGGRKAIPTSSSLTATQGGRAGKGFPEVVTSSDDEENIECTPSEHVTMLEDVTSNGLRADTPSHESQAEIEEAEGEDAATPTRTALALNSAIASTPVEQVTLPFEVSSNGLQPDTPQPSDDAEIEELEGEEVPTPIPTVRNSATLQRAPHSNMRRSPVPGPFAEVTATPMPWVRNSLDEQLSSQQSAQRKPTPEPAAEEDDTEAGTSSRPRRRPSTSSAVDKETPLSSPQKASPALPPISQLRYTQLGYTQVGYKSQAFESQRVPFDVIQQMAPQTDRSDVIVSASPYEAKDIAEGRYTHLFRDFRIPMTVARVWFYITKPAWQLRYMAEISDFTMPEDMDGHKEGIGNADFAARKLTKYAYELVQVYQLNNPVSLERMKKEGWVEEDPSATRFTYVPPGPLGALLGNLRCALFGEDFDESASQEGTTERQELAQQLSSGTEHIEHSTQLLCGELTASAPRQRHERRDRDAQERCNDEFVILPSEDAVDEDGIRATPDRTKSAAKAVVFAKPRLPPSRSQTMAEEDVVEDSPPTMRHRSPSQQLDMIRSTVRPSQATTMSAPSQSQCDVECSTTAGFRPVHATGKASSSLPQVVDDSPMERRGPSGAAVGSSGVGSRGTESVNSTQQSSLGLAALLGSSQGFGLGGIGGEQDSLMDDSKIRMPPGIRELGGWDSDGDEE